MDAATQKLMFSSETDDWATPQDLFDLLNEKHGPFDIDVCASEHNAKCSLYFTTTDDALTMENWSIVSKTLWMNPPYGRHNGGIGAWVEKAYIESRKGCKVVCLLPARTDTKWFHNYCLRHGTIEFLKGRVKFGSAKSGAPFPSMVVVFYPEKLK